MSDAAQATGAPGRRWRVEEHASIGSTQTRAKELPAWSAVLAGEQTAGRGQGERSFVSDRGGLYLSAVLPYAGDALRARGFALAVGWALCVRLRAAGFARVRLRWPNDLMVGARKVGGILVEQATRDTLAVGIGLNVRNAPWREDASLAATAGTLSETAAQSGAAGTRAGELRRLADVVLGAVAWAHEEFARVGFTGLVPRLAECWEGERRVELELAADAAGTARSEGIFAGVSESGAVRLRDETGALREVPDHWIRRLREVG